MSDWSIQRLPASAAGRSHGTAYGPFAWAVATSPQKLGDIREQTTAALSLLDALLRSLGSDRTRLLSVSVHMTDIGEKAEMDKVWCDWIGADPENWPQRTCVQAPLAGELRVEFAVVAARRESPP
jgi:enamine deaminase RidA (YjgF/YER057c/UK114 family)